MDLRASFQTALRANVCFRVRSSLLHSICLGVWVVSFAGCASLNPFAKDDEYDRARNAIEGYEDREGNWIRPEGARADKSRGKDLPKFMQKIPGLAERPKKPEQARQKYIAADEMFEKAKQAEGEERRAQFRAAAKQYLDAGKDWSSSALAQDAYMMAAESYFFAEDYTRAEDNYIKLIKEYPRTRYQDRVDQRRMEIGLYWLQFKDKFYNVNMYDKRRPWNDTAAHGKRVLEKMRLDNPTGKLADDVTMELANTAFKRENWDEALDTYRDLITTYPDSKHQFDAHFLGVKSALLAYQGAQYSIEPLEHAEKMIKQMVRQFPKESNEQNEQIREEYAEVRYRKAERLYDSATYRMNKAEAAAAKVYCQQIVADFSDTPFNDKAKAMLEQLGDMPPEPTPYLHWMTKAFPSRDKVQPLLKPIESAPPAPEAQMAEKPKTQSSNPNSPFDSGSTVRR